MALPGAHRPVQEVGAGDTHHIRRDADLSQPISGRQRLRNQLLADGKIQPIIDRAYPLAEATEAHTYLESHRQTGKVLLLP
ncbi:zinc-binding dehydrogenase [Streptomyces europaeiscabiei]|uniref:zinc-binding dehydrogenase n=1 Tax=Streptomyces europaeiscabiei TaxID=146819 RepID=UPI00062860E2